MFARYLPNVQKSPQIRVTIRTRISWGKTNRELQKPLLYRGFCSSLFSATLHQFLRMFISHIALYICEYLSVTPKAFFDEGEGEPILIQKALDGMRTLSDKDMLTLIGLIDRLKEGK